MNFSISGYSSTFIWGGCLTLTSYREQNMALIHVKQGRVIIKHPILIFNIVNSCTWPMLFANHNVAHCVNTFYWQGPKVHLCTLVFVYSCITAWHKCTAVWFLPTCGLKSFFSCGLTAGVPICLLTVPKALRTDGRGVKVLAVIGDFKSFSGGGQKSLLTFP